MSFTIKNIYGIPPMRSHGHEDTQGQKKIQPDDEGNYPVVSNAYVENTGHDPRYNDLGFIFNLPQTLSAKKQIVDGLALGAGDNPVQGRQADSAIRSNLRMIVDDDRQWTNFTRGVLDQKSDSTSMQTLKKRLYDGFDQDIDFEDMTNLMSGYARDREQAGVEQRIDLWLQNPEFFNNLIEAIPQGDLPARSELYTDPLLFRYIDTFDE